MRELLVLGTVLTLVATACAAPTCASPLGPPAGDCTAGPLPSGGLPLIQEAMLLIGGINVNSNIAIFDFNSVFGAGLSAPAFAQAGGEQTSFAALGPALLAGGRDFHIPAGSPARKPQNVTVLPEPMAFLLIGSGLLALGILRRRNRA